ncbi:TlpA family protein disulfide reductase [Pelagicoccus mobilis]|uniref:TlpA family protein disulfide reductase n=1 Tax=Pelagicoccus mobilis TaxID=415221 RepID=A0A934VSM4_9BACT|nr:TlpA disulfide reductase family protein [Pelagicoccus mobilis]MBK1878659.1 TlpA family protein disulfide reductase [Pelagicoccus mobilis]
MSSPKLIKAIFPAICLALTSTQLAFASLSLSAPPGTFEQDSQVTLARHLVEKRTTTQILKATTNSDGSLSLNYDGEPGILLLKISGEPDLTLATAEGESIALQKAGDSLKTAGSPGTLILNQYEKLRKESLARLVYPTRNDIRKAKTNSANDEEIARLTQLEVDAYLEHLRELNDFVIENAGNTMALYGSSLRWNFDYRNDELAKLVSEFASIHGNINASQSLIDRLAIANSVKLGSTAPNLSAENLKGESESLENYRGRYVLLDFWASWCPPCRVENKHYQKLAGKVSPETFTIFAVNLDTRKQLWSQAVSRDKATWVNVSDLKGWHSDLAATYGVSALPSSFLLDPEGKVIAKNLRGPVLDAKLKELGLLK